jgi:hypothetical protein
MQYKQHIKETYMNKENQEMQSEIASANLSTMSINQSIPVKFTPELLGLTTETKAEYCTRLNLNPNPHTSAEVLSDLGFRNDEGYLSYIQRHIVWDVSEQDIAHTWGYIYSDKSDQEANDFFKSSSSLTNSKSMKFISKTDPERDGHPFWHTEYSYNFPFQNGMLIISRGYGFEIIPYENVEVLVNAKTILPHTINLSKEKI